jgi:hypothetical protein
MLTGITFNSPIVGRLRFSDGDITALNFADTLRFTPKMFLLMVLATSIQDDRLPEASPFHVQDQAPHVGLRRRILMFMLDFLPQSPVFHLIIAIGLFVNLLLIVFYILLETRDRAHSLFLQIPIAPTLQVPSARTLLVRVTHTLLVAAASTPQVRAARALYALAAGTLPVPAARTVSVKMTVRKEAARDASSAIVPNRRRRSGRGPPRGKEGERVPEAACGRLMELAVGHGE